MVYYNMIMVVVLNLMIASHTYYGVRGGGGSSIFAEEDLELDRKLKTLNKPPIVTTLTEEGEIVDCIDIYKQPAFDHPLLKNHKIQMRPGSRPKTLSSYETSSSSSSLSNQISLEKVLQRFNCPKGTVPIRRTTKEDLIRAQAFTSSESSSSVITDDDNITRPLLTGAPAQHVAILRSKDNIGHQFYGVQGLISNTNPTVVNNQFSSSQVWIEAGPPDDTNTIQAGWAVSPSLFGDNKTRFFLYWHAKPVTGCYNLLCSGFVQIDKGIPVGLALKNSQYDGAQYGILILIFKDKTTGHWWLQAGIKYRNIGYWPRYLFPHMGQDELGQAASFVAWGGLTKHGDGSSSSPQMGNGHLPKEDDYTKVCWMMMLQVVNDNNTRIDADPSELEEHLDGNPNCYNIKKDGNAILFGGPGGDNC